jgi:hypothetical protein
LLPAFERAARPGYNFDMARGWESKSIEEQQAEAAQKPAVPHLRLTREQAARQREVETLRMARIRILRQMEAASSPRYRVLLEETLRDLDNKLKHLPQVM